MKIRESKRIELVFGEFSKLDAKEPKHKEDWKKLVRFGKDSFDNPVKGCLDIPYILLLGINEQIKVSIFDSFNGTFNKAYDVLELNIPLKITVLVASLGGVGGMIATMKILSLPVDHSAPPIYLLFSIEAFISFAGAFCILLLPMSCERRGILGFATFVVSLALVLALLIVIL